MQTKSIYRTVFHSLFCISFVFISEAAIAKDRPSDEKVLVESNWAFSMDLYGKLSTSKDNILFSPYSISTALAMTYAGARGQTEKQMAKVLHFSLEKKNIHAAFDQTRKRLSDIRQKRAVELGVANALWMQQDHSFTKNYTDLIANNYGGSLNRVDFKKAPEATANIINSWVQKETNNKISDLIQAGTLKPETRLVLTNAIYFKGKWSSPFKKEDTEDDTFWLSSKNKIKVPMMFQENKIQYMENELIKAVVLPYRGNDISMIIILPKKIDGVKEVERLLSAEIFRSWLPLFHIADVMVYLPKFKVTYESHMSKTLISMGMTNAFDRSADFSGLDGTRALFLSDVIHKAFVDVNEEGTEAAAATAVEGMMKSASMPRKERPKEFRADHPFLFLIQERHSGSMLFMGKGNNPQQLK